MRFFVLLYAMVFPACLIYMLPLERPANFWGRFAGCTTLCLLAGRLLIFVMTGSPTNSVQWNIFWAVRPLLALGACLLTVRASLGPQGTEEIVYCAVWAYLTREFCFDFSQIISSFLAPGGGAHDRRTLFISLLCHSGAFGRILFDRPEPPRQTAL